MEAQVPQMEPQVPQKYLIRNNTAGWVGVVKISHRGEELGEAVEPYGTVWLSELEIQVTARAPRLPEDNPFEEQVLLLRNPETGAQQEYRVRPLTLERDGRRYTPAEERYVPTVALPQEAVPAQRQERANVEDGVASPSSSVAVAESAPPAVASPPPGPQMRRAQHTLSGTPQPPPGPPDGQSWVQSPEAPGEVLMGKLKGSDEPAPDPARHPEPSHPDERFVPSVVGAQAAPQQPGGEEEFAEAVDPQIGEETGQAKAPTRPAPEGEYAQAEEVGSPGAPAPDDETYTWD